MTAAAVRLGRDYFKKVVLFTSFQVFAVVGLHGKSVFKHKSAPDKLLLQVDHSGPSTCIF